MYKCNLFKCDGAWGTSSAFADHLLGAKHLVAYFHDVRDRILSEEDVAEAAVAEFEAIRASVPKLFLAMEVVVDQERFLIQATRLPWFKRTHEELEITAAKGGAAQPTKVGYEPPRR